jgi:hypothetical protein
MRMVEFECVDDELFALDYRAEPSISRATVLPEPPTVRLAERASTHFGPPAFDWDADDTGGEIAIVIGFAMLLVLVLAAASLVLRWWV